MSQCNLPPKHFTQIKLDERGVQSPAMPCNVGPNYAAHVNNLSYAFSSTCSRRQSSLRHKLATLARASEGVSTCELVQSTEEMRQRLAASDARRVHSRAQDASTAIRDASLHAAPLSVHWTRSPALASARCRERDVRVGASRCTDAARCHRRRRGVDTRAVARNRVSATKKRASTVAAAEARACASDPAAR